MPHADGMTAAIPGDVRSAYLAAEGYEMPLAEELSRRGVAVSHWHGRLALSPDPPTQAVWAPDIWTAPRVIGISSIKGAADALRTIQRNWSAYAVVHHRRMALIGARLPPVKARPLTFPELPPASHLGAWTLLAPDRMLFSPAKTSPFVNGACLFREDRIGPPSRAYLKLWEACTRMGRWPLPGERCIDLGASPGGWTWAIARLGASVVAVDKAPLDPAIAAMPGVTERLDSAFGIEPEPVDWLFSDIIAYPARLLALVHRWIGTGAAKRIVCTIKLQGETDHAAVEEFAAIPGAVVTHLFNNKHELTLIWSCE
jgi:23S rRNA (cytidine2498-2'-O)-methyltransferase